MTGDGDRPRPIWPLLVALVAGLVYLNSLSNGFALDDLPLVRDNPEIRSPRRLPSHFLQPYWPQGGEASGLYRPVTIVSLNVNRAIAGPAALGYHAGNLLLHALVSGLVWYVVRGAGTRYGTALAAALLFAVHPLHTEAVANIAGRAELLGALFVLTAWLLHRRARASGGSGRRHGWAIAAGAAYLFALLSKESTILAPALFLVEDRLSRRDGQGRASGRFIYAAYGMAILVGLLLRVAALGGLRGAEDVFFLDNPAAFAGTWTRIATALSVQTEYLKLFVWPLRLSSDYSFDAVPLVDSPLDPRLLLGIALAVGWLALWLWGRKRAAPLALAAAIWVLFFLPASNLLLPVGTLMAERLAYLPSLAGCLIVGHLAARFGAAGDRRTARLATLATAAAAVLIAFSLRTLDRNPDWKDNAALALHDVQVTPRSAKLQAGAGIVLQARGDLAEAESAYRTALEIYPDYAQIRYNLGVLLRDTGDEPGAIEQLTRAVELSPGNPQPPLLLAPPPERAGHTNAALGAYAAGTLLNPSNHAFRFNHGRLLFVSGHTARAREVLSALVRDDPQGLPGALALALLAEIDDQPDRAESIYRTLLSNPTLPPDIRKNVEARLAALAPPE
jgi:Flp pilus assembly protein TadD